MSATPLSLTPLTDVTFLGFVRENRFVVIHFWAAWNGVDRLMQRLLETQIPDGFRQLVTFASFDIAPPAHHEICRQHNVLNVPFLAFYRDGLLVQAVMGMRTPEIIKGHVRELLDGPAA